jgi:hypothetical protein
MNLHNDKILFKQFIDNLNAKTGIDSDIIEKINQILLFIYKYLKLL